MTTTVPLRLTWADLMAMRPGPRRDQLVAEFRAAREQRWVAAHNLAAVDERLQYSARLHAQEIFATLTRDDDDVIARRQAVAASRGRAGAA